MDGPSLTEWMSMAAFLSVTDVIRKNGIIVQVNEDHSLTMRPYDEDSIEVAPVDASRPDYYGEYSLSEVYGGKSASASISSTNTVSRAIRNGRPLICVPCAVLRST